MSSLQTLERNKVGFNGKKRQVYEASQFSRVFKHNRRTFRIEQGWKFVHESECHPRRLKNVKYIPVLGGRYYHEETHYISLKDWHDGIVKCITEKRQITNYNWYGVNTFVICQKHGEGYAVLISAGKNLYKFQISEI